MAQPKYQLLQQWLRDQINSGEYTANQQIPTELELAEQFGYSRQTIRQAISGLEQEGLLKRTPGRGTFVCQQNAGRVNRSESRTRRVGVLTTYLDDYIFPGIINGIERVLSRHDYLFTLGLTHNKTLNEATALQKLLAAGVDGLIIEGTKTALPTPNEGILQSFRDAGIPMVFINGCYDGANDSYVLMDDVQSGELLTQHLIDQGHTQIGGIFKSDDIQGVKRYEGVVKGMQKNNGHIKDDCILWYTTEDVRYLFEGSMDEMILKRLADSTAVVCYNDEIAAKLIDVLRRTDAGDDILALRVHQELAIQLVLSGARVAGERHAGAAVIAHVAEYHHLHIDRRAPAARNIVHLPIINGARVIP